MERADDEDLVAMLNPQEIVLAGGWAEVPMPRQGLMTLAPIGTLIRLGYVVVNRKRTSDLRRQSADAGIPLDRRMRLVLTSDRLITFRASRFPRRRRDLLGEVASGEIVSAVTPYSSSGPMKTVAVGLASGKTIRFRVDRALAEVLVQRFGQPDS